MKIKSVNSDVPTFGTHKQGDLNCSYDEIVSALGFPIILVEQFSKSDYEWVIELDNGNVVTIYDWKIGKNYLGKDGFDKEHIQWWSIGGTEKKDAEFVKRFITSEEWSSFDNIRREIFMTKKCIEEMGF